MDAASWSASRNTTGFHKKQQTSSFRWEFGGLALGVDTVRRRIGSGTKERFEAHLWASSGARTATRRAWRVCCEKAATNHVSGMALGKRRRCCRPLPNHRFQGWGGACGCVRWLDCLMFWAVCNPRRARLRNRRRLREDRGLQGSPRSAWCLPPCGDLVIRICSKPRAEGASSREPRVQNDVEW